MRRRPPATPECAVVRGLMRDFVDGDLEAEADAGHEVLGPDPSVAQSASQGAGSAGAGWGRKSADSLRVENHVHRCRSCAIELARVEHETLRLHAEFAALLPSQPTLPADFSARLVERLVLDETAMVSAEALARARDAADDERVAAAVIAAERVRARARQRAAHVRWLGLVGAAALLLVLFGLGVVAATADGPPERVARLVVQSADETYDMRGQLLGPGNGLGEQQSMWVRHGGGAQVAWHDSSQQVQPAATLQVQHGEVQFRDGAPVLVNGRIEIDTNRPVSIPMGDGSRLDLGLGQYVVTADLPPDLLGVGSQPTEPSMFAQAPTELFIEIEVRRGDPAEVVRTAIGGGFVPAGQIGVYQGESPINYRPAPTGSGPVGGVTRTEAERSESGPEAAASMAGQVVDRGGGPGVGAEVFLSFASAGIVHNLGQVVTADGRFAAALASVVESGFAIALAHPAAARRDLGMCAPDAVQLVRHDRAVTLASPIVLDAAAPLLGVVRDEFGLPRKGVQVVPAVTDELFGHVLPLLSGSVATATDGSFRIDALPARLPAYQNLVLLLLHGAFEPAVVPVPHRGHAAASLTASSFVVRHLRSVRLHWLPANATLQVFEEVDGLPPGTALWRRSVTTDAFGRVASFLVGHGRLWLRGGPVATPMLRELRMDETAPTPLFSPVPGLPSPMASVFRPLQGIDGTGLEIVHSYRHQRFPVTMPANSAAASALVAVDAVGHPVAGAQVFSVAATGPGGLAEVRFLGFTSGQGVASLANVANDDDVVVVGVDASAAWVRRPQSQGMSVPALVQAPGRVQLHPSLRPAPTASEQVVTVRFEPHDDVAGRLQLPAVRYFSEGTGWEVGDLLPGEYGAQCGGQHS
jgi:hypothetical protein